jgi:phosphoribosyl-ATP pyrophosphohydrolase
MKLNKLYNIIQNRKENPTERSYIASLFRQGSDRIAQKIGEEATEVVIAAKNKSKQRIVSEVADLWFHTLILLSDKNITVEDIETELARRNGNNKT